MYFRVAAVDFEFLHSSCFFEFANIKGFHCNDYNTIKVKGN